MRLLLPAMMLCLLLRAETAMSAASAACRLFVTAVLPGLFPYMALSLMLVSRVQHLSPGLLMLLGWGGGSPTGARLLPLCPRLSRRAQVRLAVSCATMSPMFLLGTVGGWLNAPVAGAAVLAGVVLGGWMSGLMAGRGRFSAGQAASTASAVPPAPLSFGAAVEQSARTMLLVCGTMVMLRVFAALAAEVLPGDAALPVTTMLEVTTGTARIAALPLPLALRTALIAGAAGFGGMAILLQNRAVYPEGLMPLTAQILWQAVHGVISFLLTLGLMCLLP